MPAKTGSDPVGDDELLYRRIRKDLYSEAGPSPDAFRPTRHDETGLSVYRAALTSLTKAASGSPGKTYYVAVLRAGDLRNIGIVVTPAPLQDDPGHAELTNLTASNRRTAETADITAQMTRICREIHGPFSTLR